LDHPPDRGIHHGFVAATSVAVFGVVVVDEVVVQGNVPQGDLAVEAATHDKGGDRGVELEAADVLRRRQHELGEHRVEHAPQQHHVGTEGKFRDLGGDEGLFNCGITSQENAPPSTLNAL
jgi:hypothetical protein